MRRHSRRERITTLGVVHGDNHFDNTEICQRCGRASHLDMTYEAYECPNCGTLRWRWLDKEPGEEPHILLPIGGGHFPLRAPEETGYFIDNPNPLIGPREPAKVWVPRTV